MKSKHYDLIVFDWDGTLCDSALHIVSCVRFAAEQSQLPQLPDDSIRQCIGIQLDEFMRRLYPNQSNDTYKALVRDFHQHYFVERDSLALYPGAYDTVLTLQQYGYDLAIATGKTRQGLQLALTETALTEVFRIYACGDDGYTKPDPRILQHILDIYQIPAERTLMVGDTSFDMELANNAGVGAIAVDYGMHSASSLQKYHPLVMLQKMPDLLNFLAKS